jgi:hypothetical protein
MQDAGNAAEEWTVQMIDPADTKISQHDQEVALVLLNALARSVGDTGTQEISARDLHRVLALMAATVLETDATLTDIEDFKKAGAYFGELTAMLGKIIRDEHARTGVSMMELAATVDGSSLN